MVGTLVLRYKNILIMRPRHQADELIALLRSHGACVHHVPALDIIPITMLSPRCIPETVNCDYIIFVSVNAVRQGFNLVPELREHARRIQHVYAIGMSTAKALKRHGIIAEMGSDMNSESLLQLPALQAVENKQVLLVRGMGGRTFLAATLRKLGAKLIELRCYKYALPMSNVPDLQHLLRAGDCDAVVINSLKTLHNAHRMAGELRGTFRGLPICVPAQRLVLRARALGHAKILQARAATAEDTLAALS